MPKLISGIGWSVGSVIFSTGVTPESPSTSGKRSSVLGSSRRASVSSVVPSSSSSGCSRLSSSSSAVQSTGLAFSPGLAGSSTTRHSLLRMLNLGRFLPFPGRNPSSSANGSSLVSTTTPKDARERWKKAGDAQELRPAVASVSSGRVRPAIGVSGGSVATSSCCTGLTGGSIFTVE